ncbi:hypothetical protein [Pseudomonas carassii]|uniref:Holin n=1 Tax=Pseudomonas carassii TaxID=3115855 RepID=A0ABU7HIU8_9PSED|nr:hypothetical protein [Pseudomonas sp. 137P]MEE1891123.1 hypothetical protein [Pseudomonas sp. 137P]
MEALAALLSIVLALSVATERLVEIIKGFIPGLDQPKADPRQESRRRSYLQILAVIGGVITAYLSRDALPTELPFFKHDFGLICLGLLASGGSGFWNAILTYTAQAKELKKTAVNIAQGTSQNMR